MNSPRDSFHESRASARSRARTGRTVALLDARFIEWLGAPEGSTAPPRLERLDDLLHAVLLQAGLPPDLARVIWYDSSELRPPVNGLMLRRVAPDSADGGASLALAMARDLLLLASHGACDHVLLATDDDRLLVAVDAAQSMGLRVHLLADESALDLNALAASDAGSDASWATLLRQGDSRVIVAASEVERALWGDGEVVLAERAPVARRAAWAEAGAAPGPWAEDGPAPWGAPPGRRDGAEGFDARPRPDGRHPRESRPLREGRDGREGRDAREGRDGRDGFGVRDDREGRGRGRNAPTAEEVAAMRSALQPMVHDWWDGLPVEDREEFVEQLPAQRGLPQEVDRHLLLRLSQQLGRPLSLPEKKLMRDLAREASGADAAGSAAAGATAAEPSAA